MEIALTGSTGFVGSHLANVFLGKNWKVKPILRGDLALSSKNLARKIDGSVRQRVIRQRVKSTVDPWEFPFISFSPFVSFVCSVVFPYPFA